MRGKVVIPFLLAATLIGCGRYDVLEQIADMGTEQDFVEQTEIGMLETDMQMGTEGDSDDNMREGVAIRPEYNAADYVNMDACDLGTLHKGVPVCPTDDEAMDMIREYMRETGIYGDAETAGQDGNVVISYTAIEEECGVLCASAEDQETLVDNTIFPEEVNKKLGEAKAGDEIDLTYTYGEDYRDKEYRGKTIVYHIVVQEVYSLELTDGVAQELSAGSAKTVEDYIDFAKSILYLERINTAAAEAVVELLGQATITGYPEDVLKYDVQASVIEAYENAGVFTADGLRDIAMGKGYADTDSYLEALRQEARDNLEQEIKILALAGKYVEGQKFADTGEAEEALKTFLEEELYG